MTGVIPFSRYNEEFSSLVNQTRQTIQSISTILNQQQGSSNINDIESSTSPSKHSQEIENILHTKLNLANQLLTQTKDLLKQMTIESRSFLPNNNDNDHEECKKILAIAKANHANLKDDVTSIQNDVQHYLLLATATSTSNNNNNKKRNKNNNSHNSDIQQHLLSKSITTLHNQNSTLENSKKIMADTELIAMEITDELARNRETIQSAHSRVRGVNTLSNHARRILVNMNRREVQQKMVVYGVGVVLVLVLLFLLGVF